MNNNLVSFHWFLEWVEQATHIRRNYPHRANTGRAISLNVCTLTFGPPCTNSIFYPRFTTMIRCAVIWQKWLKHILFISSKLTLKISNLPNLWASKHVMNTKAVLFLRLINAVALFWHNFMIPRRQLVSQNGTFLLYFLTKVPKYWLFEKFGYFWSK